MHINVLISTDLLTYVTLCFWFCGLGFWFLAEQMGGNRSHQSVDSTVFEWWGRSSFGNNKIGTCKNHILRQFKPNKSTVNQFEKCFLLAPLTWRWKLKIGHSCQLAIMQFHHACLQAPNMSSQHENFWMFFFTLSGTNDPWKSWTFQFPYIVGLCQNFTPLTTFAPLLSTIPADFT